MSQNLTPKAIVAALDEHIMPGRCQARSGCRIAQSLSPTAHREAETAKAHRG